MRCTRRWAVILGLVIVLWKQRSQVQQILGVFHHTEAVEVRRDLAGQVSVWPNPARGTVNLQALPGTSYKLFNALGQDLLQGEIDGAEPVELSLQELGAGVYFVEFRHGATHAIKRLMVE